MVKTAISLFLALSAGAPLYAAVSACPSTSTALNDASLTVGLPTGPGNILVAPGCGTTLATFSNFVVDSPSGPLLIVGQQIPTPSGTTVNVTGPDASQVFLNTSTIAPGSIQISSPGPNGPLATDNGCKSNSGNGGWCVNGANQVTISTVTFVATFNSEVDNIGASDVVHVHSSGGGSTAQGGTAFFFLEVCPGTTVFSQGCANYGAFKEGVTNAKNQDVSFTDVIPFAGGLCIAATNNNQCTYAIRETIYLQTFNGAGSYASIGPADLVLSPEPGTFGLIGLSLVLLGFIRRKRRIQS